MSYTDLIPADVQERLNGQDIVVEAETGEVLEVTIPRTGFAGFVCFECRRPVDQYLRGYHKETCPLLFHNESLVEGGPLSIAWSKAVTEAYPERFQ